MTKRKSDLKQLQVEYVDIETIIPYINNAKQHPPEQVAQIAGSIMEYGFNDPVAIDETNTIIEGHGRLLAAQKLQLKTIPIIRLQHLTPAQKKAYILTHNKLTLNSGFDNQLLRLEMESLKEMDFDLNLTGFSVDEINDLIIKDFEPNLPNENNSDSDNTAFKLIITLQNEDEQQELFNELLAQGYKVKAG